MTTFSTKTFNDAVLDFKSIFNGHPELIARGQFYVRGLMLDSLISDISILIRGNLRLQSPAFDDFLLRLKERLLATAARKPVVPQTALEFLKALDGGNERPDLLPVRTMLDSSAPGASEAAEVKDLFNKVWSGPNIGSRPQIEKPSFKKAQTADILENKKCFDVIRGLARKLTATRKIGAIPAKWKISEGVIAGAKPRPKPLLLPTEVNDFDQPESLEYQSPPQLLERVAKMQQVIRLGGVVQCGVLSGVRHEHSKFPDPEHYVLAIAFGQIEGNDAFLFWDPDVGRSNINSTFWGPGFGCLFGKDGRLSTAIDDADLIEIDNRKGVGGDDNPTSGDHLRSPRRHRYQVYSLQTWPL